MEELNSSAQTVHANPKSNLLSLSSVGGVITDGISVEQPKASEVLTEGSMEESSEDSMEESTEESTEESSEPSSEASTEESSEESMEEPTESSSEASTEESSKTSTEESIGESTEPSTEENSDMAPIGDRMAFLDDELDLLESTYPEAASVSIYSGSGSTLEEAKNTSENTIPLILIWRETLLSSVHDIVWLWGSNAVINGNRMDITPEYNDLQSATLQIRFSEGEDYKIGIGEVEIRIPAHIFLERGTGEAVDDYTVPLSEKGNPEGPTGFWYYIDDGETESKADDEIVISNYMEISGAYFFQCDIQYQYKRPSKVKDGYEKNIVASFQSVTKNGIPQSMDSVNTLTVSQHTDAKLWYFEQKEPIKFETWNSDWGTKPADSEDYFYVWWQIYMTLRDDNTQPYIYEINEDGGPDGEIIGGRKGGFLSNSSDNKITNWAENGLLKMSEKVELPVNYSTLKEESYSFLVRYPRTLLEKQEGEDLIVENKATCVLTGYDTAYDMKEASASYLYVPPNDNFPGNIYNFGKLSPRSSPKKGGINSLESGNKVEISYPIEMATRYHEQITSIPGSKIEIIDDNRDEIYATTYSTRNARGEESLLTPGEDYYFSGMSIIRYSQQDYAWTDDGYVGKEVEGKDYDPMPIYIQTMESPDDWQLFGQYETIGTAANYLFVREDGTGNPSLSAAFPENTIRVKIAYINHHHYNQLQFNMTMVFNPSDHMKELCSKVTGDGKLVVNNQATYKVTDLKDNLKYEQSSLANDSFTRVEATTNAKKRCTGLSADPVKGLVTTNWEFRIRDQVSFGNFDYSQILNQYTSGEFYDLLPEGTTAANLKIVGANKKINVRWDDPIYMDNWRGSGRTMMIVRNITSENVNPEKTYEVGYILTYDIIDTWENIYDNGILLKNFSAYKSTCGELGSGWPDDGYALDDYGSPFWDYFIDLDEDQNPEGTLKDTMYASGTKQLDIPFAAEAGLKKHVKSENSGIYADNAVTELNENYSYKLRYQTKEGTSSGNLIFYDVLEEAYKKNEHWQGILTDISTIHAVEKGVNIKVYYSTKQGIEPYQENEGITRLTDQSDLTDGSIWKLWTDTDLPNELSKVTALAFDLREASGGGDFYLRDGKSVYVEIFMKASLKDETVLDESNTYPLKAYNDAACQTTTFTPGAGALTAVQTTPVVKIELRETTELDVKKEWIDTDSNNMDHTTDEIVVHLIADGVETDQILTLNESNEWMGTFEDLEAKNSDNSKIVYTVKEENIPENYIVSYTNTPEDVPISVVITNTYKPPVYKLTLHKTNITGTEALQHVSFELYQAIMTDGIWEKTDQAVLQQSGETDVDGKLTLTDLPVDYYLLYEIRAADGYRLPEEPWRITVAKGGTITVTDSEGTVIDAEADGTYPLTNETGFKLPITGGSGIWNHIVGGLLMIFLAGFAYTLQKRKGKQEE